VLNFGVRPEKQEALRKKMDSLGIREDDILEKFIHGGGKGGQKINKTASAVYLKHLPTGIEVKCQAERSQARNRLAAFRLLAAKVEGAKRAERQRKVQEREQERRRKRPRPAGLKERILESKKKVAEKKKQRGKKFEE